MVGQLGSPTHIVHADVTLTVHELLGVTMHPHTA